MENITVIQLTGIVKGYLEIKEGSAVPIVYSASDIRDVAQKTGNTSRLLILSGSNNNHRLLNYYFDINVINGSFDVNKATECMIIENGVPVMDNAVLQLLRVVKSQETSNTEQKIEYEVVVKDQTSDFFTKLGSKELSDIKLTDLNHIFNATNIQASFAHTQADGYKYLMPFKNGNIFNANEFRPAVYAKTYFDRIFADNGFSYEWDEATTDKFRFDKEIIPYNGESPKKTPDEIDFYTVTANETTDQEIVSSLAVGILGTIQPTKIDINNEISDPSASYNDTTSIYTSPLYSIGGSAINFKAVIEWELIIRNTTGANAYLVGSSGTKKIIPNACLRKNSQNAIQQVNLYLGNVNGEVTIGTGAYASGDTILESGTTECNFASNLATVTDLYNINGRVRQVYPYGNIKWRDANTVSGSLVQVNTVLKIKSVSLIIIPSMSEISFGQTVNMNNFIPTKIKQSDFIHSIFTKFNLMITVDQFNASKLILKGRDKYYDDGAVKDWSRKLARNREHTINFLPSITAKKLILSYAKDTSDEANKTYIQATNETYGQVEYTFNSEHVKNVETKSLFFAPTPMTVNSFGAVVPMINGTSPKNTIRILYDGGEIACNSYEIVDYVNLSNVNVGITATTYPLLSHFDKPFNPTYDINFAICDYYFYQIGSKTNNNTFNLHWRRTVAQINEGKMFTGYFDLDEVDISTMRLNDKIFVDNAYFQINKIERDAKNKTLSRVELLTADSEIDLPPFEVQITEYEPPRGDIRGNVTNAYSEISQTGLNVLLTNANIQVNGQNNSVGQDVRGGLIVGNGNNVSSDSVVIGDDLVVEERGVYTPLIQFPDLTQIRDRESLQEQASRFIYDEIEITTGFILSLGTTSRTILPAPGVGNYYEYYGVIENNFNTVAFDALDNVAIGQSESDKSCQILSSNFHLATETVVATFNSQMQIEELLGDTVYNAVSIPQETNKQVRIFNVNGNDSTVGDGSFLVKIYYRIRTIGTEL